MNHNSEAAIRAAFASGEFDKAQRLWSEYAANLHEAILNRTANVAMLSQARELIDWASLTVNTLRAHTTDQLNAIHVARSYDWSE
jgi:hypothetical protein